MSAKRSSSGKKVVRAADAPEAAKGSTRSGSAPAEPPAGWTPTPGAKKQAGTHRLIAALLWALAIAGEVVAIFWVLRQDPVNMVLLIGLIVVIGLLAVGGSLLWKKANRLDPASREDKVRFFVQNQLGAIVTIVAFLPLIVLVLLNDSMDKKDKAIAGTVGVVVLAVAAMFGVDWDPPSVEQYSEESQTVIEITGQDLVFWTSQGQVFHLCADASAVNRESADNTIYSGTVAEAHAAGKSRLTLQVDQEKRQCGFDTEQDPADGTEPDSEPGEDQEDQTQAP